MAAHLTPAQARALGIGVPGAPPARSRRTRHALARDRAVSACHTCGATFTTDAAETRHVADTFHARYDTGAVQSAAMSDTPTTPDPLEPDAPADPDGPDEPDDD